MESNGRTGVERGLPSHQGLSRPTRGEQSYRPTHHSRSTDGHFRINAGNRRALCVTCSSHPRKFVRFSSTALSETSSKSSPVHPVMTGVHGGPLPLAAGTFRFNSQTEALASNSKILSDTLDTYARDCG